MKKIVLVEDDKNLSVLIQRKLEKKGYEVRQIGDGKDALSFIKREKPDLVLLDVDLPYKTGIELLEEIRQDKALSSLDVIIISNSGNPVDVHRVRELGVRDYLIKVDFDLDELERLIREHLSRRDKSERRSPSGNILVVEDDKFLRDLIGMKLAQSGFIAKEAADANDAFKLLEAEPISLILLDLILPGADGYEVMRRLKADPRWKDIPVIVFSNLSSEEEEKKVREAGAVEYMLKAEHPPGVIVEKIRDILASRPSSRSS